MTPSHEESSRRFEELECSEYTNEKGYLVLEARLRVPEDLLYLRGHFEGNPVLPGVVQLNEGALDLVETYWSDLGRLERVRRLKFIHIIRPGDVIVLRLERKLAPGQVVFTIKRGDQLCTSATLIFAEKESP